MMKTFIYGIRVIILMMLFIGNVYSQNVLQNIDNQNNMHALSYPWAGGINAVQYCDVDLNLDGIMDLLVFDRRGNRKICFLNGGESGVVDYVFSPEYAELLPDFHEWVMFKDYNMDGKNDIFTYSPGYGSMMVYKNISTDVLKFELVAYPYLKTYYPGGYVNLFVTSADYPGIADVDNDGDLDILTFGVLGSFVGMHKNMSMEKYGVPDSLDFEHTTYCWGQFAESDESNELFLDTCMPRKKQSIPFETDKDRHTGSTLLLHDFDDNGLVDLLLGDVDYPELFALYNTGTNDDAHITNVDTVFPQGSEEIRLFSMPLSAYIDVNNDNKNDLLVSPFDPGIITSQNKNSSWYYKNLGTNNNPVFELVQKNFLQSDMIDVGSGAYPVLFDWNNDGLKDLFVGNYGYYIYSYYENYFLHSVYYSSIAYFKNVGTSNIPVFELVDNNFAGLRSLQTTALLPSFIDVNNDGHADLLVGNSDGKIIYARYNIQSEEFDIVTQNYLGIDVGDFSTPQLFDLNKDGLLDLVIGEKAGNINYFKNIGTVGNPDFEEVTDSLGKINVTDYNVSWDGYSTPSFFIDKNQNTGLVVGTEQGDIYYYTNIDDNLGGKFNKSSNLNVLLDTSNINFDRGMRTAAIICDLYSGGKLEMIVGNYSGGLEYFNGSANVNYDNINAATVEKLDVFPIPTSGEVTINFTENINKATITLYGYDGKIVQSGIYYPENYSLTYDLPTVKNGVYILLVDVGGKVTKNKIVVIK